MADLCGARVDLQQMHAFAVAHVVEAMKAGQVEPRRDKLRRTTHLRTIDTADDARMARLAIHLHDVHMDRGKHLAVAACDGACRGFAGNEALQTHHRLPAMQRREKMMRILALCRAREA